MDQEPDVIRRQIEETRHSLTDKLEALEEQVRGRVQSAKSTVEETIEKVKRTFDVKYQVDQHPWAMTGGSVLVGFVAGTFLSRRLSCHANGQATPPSAGAAVANLQLSDGHTAGGSSTEAVSAQPAKPGLVAQLRDQFKDEIEQVKALAIGAIMGVLRDVVKESLPPHFAPQIDQVMNSATTKLGGEPVPPSLTEPQFAMPSSRASSPQACRTHPAR